MDMGKMVLFAHVVKNYFILLVPHHFRLPKCLVRSGLKKMGSHLICINNNDHNAKRKRDYF